MPVPRVRQTPAIKTARVYPRTGVIGRAGASHVCSRPTKSLVGAAASAAAQHDHEDDGDGDRDSGADQEEPGLPAPAGLVSLFVEGCHDLTSSLSLFPSTEERKTRIETDATSCSPSEREAHVRWA